MLIQEVILENFMSYEYARVPFRPGVNVIGGPNGAGKSSLLLAISVGLGQSYTERSRKLSDLIRWGKDQARVTLILDNSKRGGKRPVPRYNKDQIFLTRVLRKDGKYWFELENHAATKQDVERLLGRFGVDPDNMLIIMHQNMVEQFTVLSNVEKLRMVEAAVGLEPFRENVLQAQHKLTRILSQSESVGKLLESAEQTLNYWREQYDKYQEKKQLQTKRRFLDRELAWAEVEQRESIFKELQADRNREQEILNRIEEEIKTVTDQLRNAQSQQETLKNKMKVVFNERLGLERGIAENQSTLNLYEQLLEEASVLESTIQKDASRFKLLRTENLKAFSQSAREYLAVVFEKVKENQAKMLSLEEAADKMANQILENRVQHALLKYRRESAAEDLERINAQLKDAKASLDSSMAKAEQSGARIAVTKNVAEVLDEIRVTDGHLAALADVSEDIERMYESYSKLYLELKEKAQVVAENRQKALEEVKTRMQAWRTVMQNLMDRVNLEYQKIMSKTLATGEVRLANGHDIETAGLEILVGFKGGKPVPLDAYTQSGGERTTATMSFLLALQQHVRSPFRAVDEYDIHMDPKNREMIARMLLSLIKDATAQYIVITPSQITFAQENANIITVQNVEGKSVVREVA
ncbi:AAA family ATPase [Candidatus Bathyarchaeota archaeon A05DMB-2]|jgi:chromosome segregation ATPase|nr:AAA family ATPase [Candidatus Bathyarchaeota archaeon A05DMB-2]